MKLNHNSFIVFLVLIAVIFAAYGMILGADFKTLDDEMSIVKNELLRDWSNIARLFTKSFFDQKAYYRPLVSVSFLGEYQFFNLNASMYYFSNLLIHAFNAWIVWRIFALIFGAGPLALAGGFLFAIHPIHWEAVTNIPGRAILLSAAFEMLTLYLFILSRQRKSIILYLISLCVFIPALLSKESAGVLPFILIAYLVTIGRERNIGKIIKTVLPYFIVITVYLLWRRHLGITELFYWRNITEALFGFTTFLRSVFTHLRMLFLPFDLHFDRARAVYTSFSQAGVWITWTAVFLISAILWRTRRSMPREGWFFFLWTAVAILPVSQFYVTVGVQPGYISTADHFLYVPFIGLMGLFFIFVRWFAAQNQSRKLISPKMMSSSVLVVFIFFFLVTVTQVIYSRHEVAMLERTLKFNPNNVRMHNSLGLIFGKFHRYEESEYHFKEALKHDPFNVRATIGLGKVLVDEGRYWEGIRLYEELKAQDIKSTTLNDNLADTYEFLRCRYTDMLDENPENALAAYSLGVVYAKINDWEKAAGAYEWAIRSDPNLKNAWYNLGGIYEKLSVLDQAVHAYRHVITLPGNPELDVIARARLSDIYRAMGDSEGAEYFDGSSQ